MEKTLRGICVLRVLDSCQRHEKIYVSAWTSTWLRMLQQVLPNQLTVGIIAIPLLCLLGRIACSEARNLFRIGLRQAIAVILDGARATALQRVTGGL